MYVYKSINDAVEGLLCDVCRILNDDFADLNYMIVGGWSPYLLCQGVVLHPGTKDVDVLFYEGNEAGKLDGFITKLLDNGYTTSAKHDFQLIKILKVLSSNGPMDFAFNVDLLHPKSNVQEEMMFVEHKVIDNYNYRSIVIPIFASVPGIDVVTQCRFEATLPDGKRREVHINLMNEVGCVVSKGLSLISSKRYRDPFDLAISIHQSPNKANVRQDLIHILRSGRYEEVIDNIKLVCDKSDHYYQKIIQNENNIKLSEEQWRDMISSVSSVLQML